MIIGTTAKFEFQLPYPFKDLDLVRIIFTQQQDSNTPVTIIKYLTNCRCGQCGHIQSECTCTTDSMSTYVTLEQGETLHFSDKYKVMVQFRGRLRESGAVFASRERWINVYPLCESCTIDETQVPDIDLGEIILDGGDIGDGENNG